MSNPLTGKHFLHVSYPSGEYPSGEYYYAVPNDWKLEDINLIDVTLYYKGEKSSITAFDYLPNGEMLEIVDDPESITRICHEYII